MQIELDQLSKRFNTEWIFKNISHTFSAGSTTGIVGSNGSGKSTLLKIISGAELPSKGKISYFKNDLEVKPEEVFTYINFSAPYMDLADELSCEEVFDFTSKFKHLNQELSKGDFFDLVYLTQAKNKFVKNLSSGMKQRLKLGLAICFDSDILILDEPCSNLDKKGTELYGKLINKFNSNRTTLIGSNEQEEELLEIDNKLNVLDFKSSINS